MFGIRQKYIFVQSPPSLTPPTIPHTNTHTHTQTEHWQRFDQTRMTHAGNTNMLVVSQYSKQATTVTVQGQQAVMNPTAIGTQVVWQTLARKDSVKVFTSTLWAGELS